MRTKTHLNRSLVLASVLLFTFGSCKKNDALTESAKETESLSARSGTSPDSNRGPAPPANIRLDPSYDETPFTVRITWDDPAGEIVYEFYDADSGQRVLEIPGTATFFITNGNRSLLAGHKYFVKARDRSGNRSAPSNTALISASCQI